MVIDLVRGKRVASARDVLRFSKNRGARILSKLLDSAVATAKSLGQGDEANLMVLKIAVDEGPKLKRWRARAKGSAYPIQKKVSHITLILDEVRGVKLAQPSVQETKEVKEAVRKEHIAVKTEKPKFKAVSEERKTSKETKGIQKFFRRKVV
jgi:large subunit ribosomal protein L22